MQVRTFFDIFHTIKYAIINIDREQGYKEIER